MIQRLQRTSTIVLLSLTLLWLAGCAYLGVAAWIYSGALLIFFSHAVVLALEFVILYVVHGSDPAPRASARAMARAWFVEARMAMQVFNWRQPFRSHLYPDTIDEVPSFSSHDAVVLVHGLICNRGIWLPMLEKLKAAGIPYLAINLEPVFADSIDQYIPLVEAAVRRAHRATGRPPVILAHSMGGLATRAWLAWSRTQPGGGLAVKRTITIGTPHQGTWLARLGRAPSTHQMRIGSEWLKRLTAAEARNGRSEPASEAASAAAYAAFTCFHSNCDNIVMPAAAATLQGADNRLLRGAAHIELAFRPEVMAEVLRWTIIEPS